MSGPILTVPAFAKINWTLRVLGKRADGFHEIDTVFQTITLHDTITLTATYTSEIVLWCDDRSLPTTDNLVYRAAESLQARFAPNQGARIRLEKRIPAQAGLGGGASDAAVTLLGLAHLWKLGVNRDDLLEIAAGLGADVPFFFFGGRARGTGIGSHLSPIGDVDEKFLLVLKPNAIVSTGLAYKALDADSLTSTEAKSILSSSPRDEIFDSFHLEALQNDFEPVIFQLAPEIERAKAVLIKAGAVCTLLAGSGSAVFGVFNSRDTQERAIQAIELEAGWRVFPCATLGREAYRSKLGDLFRRLG